ncbi:coenzyme Q biosynthesis protein Coq4-domain-containing protein [Melampsora americana]|nr:coenzyme Q biosynthesis protein Coq4-domain-containing protein [Melampsora americana]
MVVYRSISRVVRLPINLTLSLSRAAIGAEPPIYSHSNSNLLSPKPIDLPFLRPQQQRQLNTTTTTTTTTTTKNQKKSIDSNSNTITNPTHPHPNYEHHVSLNSFEQSFLAIGSALASLNDPHRGDMIAVLSETTAGPFLNRLRDQMCTTESGRKILKTRPRIRSNSLDLDRFRKLKKGSFGQTYVEWLEKCKVSPDTREPVRYIDSPELAYVMQRYRECHDFYHVISGGFPVSVSGEIVVKWFELANMGLPVAALSALFGPLRLSSGRRGRLLRTYVPWALKCGSSAQSLISVDWESHWETDLKELREMLGIWDPPVDWNTWKEEEMRIKREQQVLNQA